jgi:voltage-gated potassium channel
MVRPAGRTGQHRSDSRPATAFADRSTACKCGLAEAVLRLAKSFPSPQRSKLPTQPVNPFRRFRLPVLILTLVFCYGVIGYMLLEHWSFVDALFMTLITVTTVGYDEVHPLGSSGRVFTMTLIVSGVGTMLYTLGIFGELLVDGRLARYARMRGMERRLDSLQDHFIVCGYGRMGTRVAEEFAQLETPFVVVDNNQGALDRLRTTNLLFVEGDATSDETLMKAGILRAKGLVSAVDSDERNVFITLTARALNPALFIVARSSFADSAEKLRRAGANQVVSPYLMGAHRMAVLAVRPVAVDVLDTVLHGENIDLVIEEFLVPSSSRLLGRTLADSGLRGGGANVLAIRKRSGQLRINPPDSQVLESDDLLVAIGTRQQVTAAEQLL